MGYDRPVARLLFDLIPTEGNRPFAPWPQEQVSTLANSARDLAARRLGEGVQERQPLIERFLIGRGATGDDVTRRVRIIPLPTIGHPHADPAIRRLLVEVPPDCPLSEGELAWALSGQELANLETGVLRGITLVRNEDTRMLRHYGIGGGAAEERGFRRWRTVTPCVLPEQRPRGRLSGGERRAADERAAAAVCQALRHAGLRARRVGVRVQSEPFRAKGVRADAYEVGRFDRSRLRHVEVELSEPVTGPLVIGDGRYVGLGLMAPAKDAWRDLISFTIKSETGIALEDGPVLMQAVRRALMALARNDEGRVPVLFSGHAADGGPARNGHHEHVFLAADDADGDGLIDRLIVAAPWICDRTVRGRRGNRERFDRTVSGLAQIRAGQFGIVAAECHAVLAEADPLIGPARVWESRTPYRPTRHTRRSEKAEVVMAVDIARECQRRGILRPSVRIVDVTTGPKGALLARARLQFATEIKGPLMLGGNSHVGSGLFIAVEAERAP